MNKEKEEQAVFNITDENYKVYKKLYKIKTELYDEKDILKIILIGTGSVVLLGVLGALSVLYVKDIITAFNLIKSEIDASIYAVATLAVDGAIGMSLIASLPKIVKKFSLRKFRKKYPDIDTNVNIENLEKALTKYEELSKIPKDIEKKKEQCLINHSDEFKKKTTDEKISELKKEIEFWEQVKIEEKYKDNYTENSVKTLKKTYNPNNKI